MSFLIDVPWLYANGRALGRIEDERAAKALGAATVAGFYGVSIPLYLNRAWTRPIWRACRARSGRDWMLNSGILRLDDRKAGTVTHAVSAAILATYPFWLWLGHRHQRR